MDELWSILRHFTEFGCFVSHFCVRLEICDILPEISKMLSVDYSLLKKLFKKDTIKKHVVMLFQSNIWYLKFLHIILGIKKRIPLGFFLDGVDDFGRFSLSNLKILNIR